MQTDLYDTLEIPIDANQQEIKAAMIRLGKKYVVRSQVDHLARTRFDEIKEAYKVISNPYRRANYDNFLQQNEEIRNNSFSFDIAGTKIYCKQKGVRIWNLTILLLAIAWQLVKSNSIVGWYIAKRKTIQTWKILKQWFFITIQAIKRIRNGEKLTLKGWEPLKIRETSMHVRQTIINSEKIIHRAYPHLLFYVDLIGLIFFFASSYLLLNEPDFIQQNIPRLILWIPWLDIEYVEISVWSLGLGTLVFIGIMVVWEAFVDNKTTELIITTRRIVHKTGLLNRTVIDLKLGKFESIIIKQSIIGRFFNYGTITITGMSKMQTTVYHIVAPSKFKKQLWQVLEQLQF